MLPVSVFIIAKNEADRIGDTIRAVRHLTDDLIVIDSGSTDGTQAIAEELGARVIFNEWPGYGPQKRFGEDQCRYEDRKSTRLNSSHANISYAVFCLKKKKKTQYLP